MPRSRWTPGRCGCQDSVKFVNTYRLDLTTKDAQAFMRKQMEVYFGFAEGDMADTAWTPPKP